MNERKIFLNIKRGEGSQQGAEKEKKEKHQNIFARKYWCVCCSTRFFVSV